LEKFWGSVIDGEFYIGDVNERFMTNKCQLVPMMFGHAFMEAVYARGPS